MRELISDEAAMLALDTECILNKLWGSSGCSLAELSALCAEKLGEFELAERYAAFVLERHERWHHVTRFTGRMVLARAEQRRGKREAALAHFEAAAEEALGATHPLRRLLKQF